LQKRKKGELAWDVMIEDEREQEDEKNVLPAIGWW
jgi:hypothetical protein